MARPKKETAQQLRERIERYFSRREAEGRFPTEAGMLLELGMSEAEYAERMEDGRYRPELERARLRRMDWLENQMVTESGRATGCMNALKQEKNGGYADKAGTGSEKRLVIRLEGVGSGAAE